MDRSSSPNCDERRSGTSRRRLAEGTDNGSNGKATKKSRKLLDSGLHAHGERREEEPVRRAESEEPPLGVEIVTEKSNGEKSVYNDFAKVVKSKLSPGSVQAAIFMHPHPDPDAVGSAMGLQWLLSKAFKVESHIFYEGDISHPQNNAIVNLLDPQLRRVDEYKPDDYQLNILCDTVPKNAGVGECKVTFDIVIDHHKDSYINGHKGLFIHVKTGSCSAIVFSLMQFFCKREMVRRRY
jgi:hypothetical protein